MSAIRKLTDELDRALVTTVAIVDNQWGDAGKGKFVDCFAEWADIIARGTGGANAGHTIKIGDVCHVFHLLPSGILWDDHGKLNVIGRGVAVEPRTLSGEIETLEAVGNHCKGLRVSHNAHLVLPFDIALDRLKEAGKGANTIGTTGRGIGPVYESKLARIGLSVNDLLNKDAFAKALKRNLESRIGLFRQFDPELVRETLTTDAFENGIFYAGPERIFDIDAIIERYLAYAKRFAHTIVDTDALLRESIDEKKILLEGAQGVLLSVSYGTYPFVTSSDCSLSGLVEGVGLPQGCVDYTLGMVKAPYMTRVGRGPFPTELGGSASAMWCDNGTATRESERGKYPDASLNAPKDDLEQGVAIRRLGNEYGATTGRLRRVGWLDLPLLRYAGQFGSQNIALTKVDVLNDCETIRLCVRHRYMGDTYHVGDLTLEHGDEFDEAIPDSHVLEHCEPIYADFPGWRSELRGAKKKQDLPRELLNIIETIENEGFVSVDVLSVGADRDDTIVL